MKVTQSDLEIVLTRCKDAFIWAAYFQYCYQYTATGSYHLYVTTL
jgi:hypothetical protein